MQSFNDLAILTGAFLLLSSSVRPSLIRLFLNNLITHALASFVRFPANVCVNSGRSNFRVRTHVCVCVYR